MLFLFHSAPLCSLCFTSFSASLFDLLVELAFGSLATLLENSMALRSDVLLESLVLRDQSAEAVLEGHIFLVLLLSIAKSLVSAILVRFQVAVALGGEILW